jgi:hypothetical protein
VRWSSRAFACFAFATACDGAASDTRAPQATGPKTETPARDAGEAPFVPNENPHDASIPDASAPPSFRLVAISDFNGSYGATTYEDSVHDAVTAIVESEKPELVLINGDMVAGQQANLDYPAMWHGFHAVVTDKLTQAGILVAPAPGNHDASGYASYEGERAEYERQWKPSRVPAVDMVDGSHFPFHYSFRYKGVFFVALDATTVEPLSNEQREWVETQLDGASSDSARIVYGHVPIHPTTIGRETEVLADDDLETMLVKKNALFIGGHHHGYFPGVSHGLHHIVTPCIGSGPRALIGTEGTSPRGFVVIDISAGKVRSIDARTGANFASNIARSSLPESIASGTHTLQRDDLAGF